jgi:hypothetical protein
MEVRRVLLPAWLEDELAAKENVRIEESRRQLDQEWTRRVTLRAMPGELPQAPVRGPAGAVRLFDPAELEKMYEDLARRHADSDDRRRVGLTLKQMSEAGPWRKSLRSSKVAISKLEHLRSMCPNFGHVIDYVLATLALHRGPVALTPICLDGPAGCGKTFMAAQLADALALPFRRIDMGAAQAAFSLTGSDRGWGNSRTGDVHEALFASPSCSPLLLLDELDKGCSNADDRYPIAPALLALLEPTTARDFRDASIPIAMDARFIVWCATSNDASLIPGPLLSRMRVFEIKPMEPAAMRDVVRRMAASIWREARRRDEMPLIGEDVVKNLVSRSLRGARHAIAEALGRALLDRRGVIEVSDLPDQASTTRPIGFM